MMGWNDYGWANNSGIAGGGMGWGFGIGAFLFWLVAFIDLILLGIFLFKKINK